ncbi:MAG: PKD domain-containing protein [Sinimarinibacterium sp.]|jgi:hypothetical protein
MKWTTRLCHATLLSLAAWGAPSMVWAANVGYYEMCNGQGASYQVAPINAAGHTPVNVTVPDASQLAGIDVLFVTNCDNGGFGGEYLGNLSSIAAAVHNDGLVLVLHDRYVAGAGAALPGSGGISFVRDFSDHSNIDLRTSNLVTNGPAGTLTDASLDGGCSSSHGYADAASLPVGAINILSTGTASHSVLFSYGHGAGKVLYSSIPLDFYLAGNNCNIGPTARNVYTPNVITYAASLLNGPPTANAGPDQTVDELTMVQLDGSSSVDPEGQPLSYSWVQTAGPLVTLSGSTTATPTFLAPDITKAQGQQTLTFELTVSDGSASDSDSVDVTAKHVNARPVADAGNDAAVREGVSYALDGSLSYDPDGDELSYTWTQTAGSAVVFDPSGSVVAPTFVVPLADGNPLSFRLVVSDGVAASVPDNVTVTPGANNPPLADAGPDDTQDEGSLVILNGGGSSDPDGDGLSYQWLQTGGPAISLDDSTSITPKFTAPAVSAGGEDLIFQLVVTDDYVFNPKTSSADVVAVHLRNANDPPTCAYARPSLAQLWPPDHRMEEVTIEGVMDTDSDYNRVQLQITGVTQDEPLLGTGAGDTTPDAAIQSGVPADTALIRAERKGNGNGRVYRIDFTADDGFESCSGAVNVTVQRDRSGKTAGDDGQSFNSLQP